MQVNENLPTIATKTVRAINEIEISVRKGNTLAN